MAEPFLNAFDQCTDEVVAAHDERALLTESFCTARTDSEPPDVSENEVHMVMDRLSRGRECSAWKMAHASVGHDSTWKGSRHYIFFRKKYNHSREHISYA